MDSRHRRNHRGQRLFSIIFIEVTHHFHGFFRRVNHRGNGSSGGDDSHIIPRSMCMIEIHGIGSSQAPEIGSISLKLSWIGYAPSPIDQGLILVFFPVVRILIFEAFGMDAQVRLVGPKKRTT